MRRNFMISWPQAVVLLVIAGTILFRPEFNPWRIAVGCLLVVLVAIGVGLRMHYGRNGGTNDTAEDEESGDPTTMP